MAEEQLFVCGRKAGLLQFDKKNITLESFSPQSKNEKSLVCGKLTK
jgi:hypothetical protein